MNDYRQKYFVVLNLFFVVLPMSLLLSNCSMVERPQVGSNSMSSLTSFDHTGIGDNCMVCHGEGGPFNAFPAVGHIDTAGQDCRVCHTPAGWRSGAVFNHTPTPASCTACHTSRIPAVVVNEMNHAFVPAQDCKDCHLAGVGVTWTGGYFSHTPAPGTCQVCHDSQRPTALVGSPPFSHVLNGTGDCVSCHTTSIGVSWVTTAFSHTPVPTSCRSCHLPTMPSVVVNKMNHTYVGAQDCRDCHLAGVGVTWTGGVFSHAPAPTTCQTCHNDQRPTVLVGTPPFSHIINGTGDCVTCHTTSIGVSWATGTYSHSPVPTTCKDCHLTNMPSAVINKMNHSYTSALDCKGCHLSGVGVTWTTGVYGHTPAPTTCQTCHESQRPTVAVGIPPFNHSVSGTGDCKACHTIGSTWAGGHFPHTPTPTTCVTCHASQVPTGTVPNTSDGFNHAPTYGTDCVACHTTVPANIGVSWTKGYFGHNGNNSSSFTNCSPCHATKKHNPTVNCATCHRSIVWPRPSTTGSYGGEFGGG